jgi:hypothetical protein
MFVAGGAGMVQPPAIYPEVADQFDDLADEWLAGQGGPGAEEFLSRLRGADAVLLNGEGSLYRTNLSAIRELFVAWLCKTRLGIPTVYLNGRVHLTNVMPILPAMVRKTFAELDAVAVRDPFSLRNLAREHGSCRDDYRTRLQAVCQTNRSDAAGLGRLAVSALRNSVCR